VLQIGRSVPTVNVPANETPTRVLSNNVFEFRKNRGTDPSSMCALVPTQLRELGVRSGLLLQLVPARVPLPTFGF